MTAPADGPAPRKRPAFEPAARLLTPTGYDPDMKRPASIVAGTALVLLSAIAGAVVLLGVVFSWNDLIANPDANFDGFDPTPEGRASGFAIVVGAAAAAVVADLVLAVFVYLGRNWARVIVMLFAVVEISGYFVTWWAQGQEITLGGTFLSVAIDILLLLALSSRSAAAYARRLEHPAS